MIATYPGTFDPVTKGHEDLIRRASKLFPQLIVAVAESRKKNTLFSLAERVELVKAVTQDLPNVKVIGFDYLLVDLLKQNQSLCIVRGARAVSDFEYEFQMAGMNQLLLPEADRPLAINLSAVLSLEKLLFSEGTSANSSALWC